MRSYLAHSAGMTLEVGWNCLQNKPSLRTLAVDPARIIDKQEVEQFPVTQKGGTDGSYRRMASRPPIRLDYADVPAECSPTSPSQQWWLNRTIVVKHSQTKLLKLASYKDLRSGKQLAYQQIGEPDMEFPEHIAMMVHVIVAFAGCLVALACVAIGAVITEPRKDAACGEGLLITARLDCLNHGSPPKSAVAGDSSDGSLLVGR